MKLLVSLKIPKEVLECLEKEHEVEPNPSDQALDRKALVYAFKNKEGVMCTMTDRIDRHLLARAPRLKMIANFGVGYDHVDVKEATKRGILVSNTPDVVTDATADIAFALILSTARRVVEGDRRIRAMEWGSWAPLKFLGTQITGKTLGIVGLGRIGRAVAKRAKGFDMRVLYHKRRRLDGETEKALGVRYAEPDDLFEKSDFVSLHVPLTEQTRHLIGAGELARMKPGAFLINTSRGPVVDERALVEALERGALGGAGLDVYENEPEVDPGLVALENVILLPHVGSATLETRTAMAERAAQNLLAGLRGERPQDCLNWKDVIRQEA